MSAPGGKSLALRLNLASPETLYQEWFAIRPPEEPESNQCTPFASIPSESWSR
jgi:hypothetical protein